MQSILYYTLYPGASTHPEGWVAVDLHTGETLWTKTEAEVNGEVLRCGQIFNDLTPNQYGGQAYLWAIPASGAGFGGSPSYMSMYDAMTGEWILNITGSLGMTLTTDEYGSLIGYYTNSTINFATQEVSASLTMWNSTRCINLNVANYGGGDPLQPGKPMVCALTINRHCRKLVDLHGRILRFQLSSLSIGNFSSSKQRSAYDRINLC
jgi:hypothetical protein